MVYRPMQFDEAGRAVCCFCGDLLRGMDGRGRYCSKKCRESGGYMSRCEREGRQIGVGKGRGRRQREAGEKALRKSQTGKPSAAGLYKKGGVELGECQEPEGRLVERFGLEKLEPGSPWRAGSLAAAGESRLGRDWEV